MMDLYGTFRSKDTEDTDTEDTSQLLGNQIWKNGEIKSCMCICLASMWKKTRNMLLCVCYKLTQTI